mgnify:FL=1
MPKETCFNPWWPDRGESLVGCIIIHPDRGTGLITAHDVSSTLGDSRWYVLWADRGVCEDIGESVLRGGEVIRPEVDERRRFDWNTARGR